jgi:hypothetical protein
MEVARSRVTPLGVDETNDVFPSWSPDGSQLAFHSNRDGNLEFDVVGADGAGLENLTNYFRHQTADATQGRWALSAPATGWAASATACKSSLRNRR